eukprot:297197-Prymnesium_polylepis.1
MATVPNESDGRWRDDRHLRAPRHLRCHQRRTGTSGTDNSTHTLSVECITGQVQCGCQALCCITFAVAIGNPQLRARQQVVSDAVCLVVDLAQCLVHAHAWRPRHGVEHWQQHAKPHLRSLHCNTCTTAPVIRVTRARWHLVAAARDAIPLAKCHTLVASLHVTTNARLQIHLDDAKVLVVRAVSALMDARS